MATIPNPNPIPNSGLISYSIPVSDTRTDTSANVTNIVYTQINTADISQIKSVDQSYANVGDILTYTIVLSNTGDTIATNVVFSDTIPSYTSFINNSFILNGLTQIGVNPNPPGYNIGNIEVGSIATVQFNVKVNSIPTVNPVNNSSTSTFTYTVDPSIPNASIGYSNSNIVSTTISSAIIDNTNGGGLVKSVDTDYARVGDILTYTISLKNTGNVTATNVIFTDTIPSGTSFVPNSAILNGVIQNGAVVSPPTGIFIGTLPVGLSSTITFNVTVTTIPVPNPIPNNGTVNYNYTVNPSILNGGVGSGNTNTVNTKINQAFLTMIKSVSQNYAKVGDILTYTISVKNTGNVTATNIIFTDTIPNGTIFIADSVILNGLSKVGEIVAPPNGTNIGSIAPSFTSTLSFNVSIITIPQINPITNNSTVNYNYTINPAVIDGGTASGNSNAVSTQVNQAIIDNTNGGGLVKTVSENYTTIGEILTYTIALTNTGNVTATNIVLTDTIPVATSFVANSVIVNGLNQIGASVAPPTGVNIGQIAVGGVSTLSFKVTVNRIPNPNSIPNNATVNYNYTENPTFVDGASGSGNSNTVITQAYNAVIDNVNGGGLVKVVNESYGKIGDILTYTITLKNTGNITANSVVLTDTIPNGTVFIADSVILNGVAQTGAVVSPPNGINIGAIGSLSASTVSFNVKVIQMPVPNPIPNSATVTFNYSVDPSINVFSRANTTLIYSSGNTNTVTTQINEAIIDNTNGSGMLKSVNENFGQIGDILTYTIALKNTGNVTATNIVLTDTIPNGTVFIADSIILNGVTISGATVSPPTGLNVGNIGIGLVSTVSFNVKVISLPVPNPITNNSTVNYNYTVNPAVPNGQVGSGNSNAVSTKINQAIIDNTNGGGFVKSVSENFGLVGDTLTYTINLSNTGNVTATNIIFTDTIPSGTSFISNSLYVNGIATAGSVDPPTGVAISQIGPQATASISFNVSILTVPTINPIPNSGSASYSYIVNPNTGATGAGYGNTNIVTTEVVNPQISASKSTNTTYADIGNILTYTIIYNNTGNVTLSNIFVLDTMPNGTTFVNGSFYLNGVREVNANPNNGYNIGSISPNGISTISFNIQVVSIPTPNPITNNATASYNYFVNPNANPISSGISVVSNSTQVNNASFDPFLGGFSKSLDRINVTIGTTITYTLVLKNVGNVVGQNIILYDTIPDGTSFVSGSVIVNGVSNSGNIGSGISLNNISPANVSTVSFIVLVNSITSNYLINNQGYVTYNYVVNPSLSLVSGNNLSNIVTSREYIANVNLQKTSDTNKICVGNTVNYYIRANNTGNVTAVSVLITDILPASLSFVTGSVYLNTIPKPSYNILNGFIIPTISASSVYTISFKALAVSVPRGGYAVNTANANYSYLVDPSLPIATRSNISNQNTLQVYYCIDPSKIIPCNSICNDLNINSGFLSNLNINNANPCSRPCNPCQTFTTSGLCTADSYACMNTQIGEYLMWQEQSVVNNFEITLPIGTIENLNGSVSIIRSDTILTPSTFGCSNLEGKTLSGYKQIIEGVIKYTITQVSTDGDICEKDYYGLFSSFIVVNPTYSNCSFDVNVCIEDLSILAICKKNISFASTMILYLTPKNSNCNSNCICPINNILGNCVSNSSLCSNIMNFLTGCQRYWSEFNVFFTTDTTQNNIGSLSAIKANISNINYKIAYTNPATFESNEGLNLTGTIMMVSCTVNVKLNYSLNDGSGIIKRMNIDIPASTYIVIDNNDLCSSNYNLTACIEDIYACNIDGENIFINSTILIKAIQCTNNNCC